MVGNCANPGCSRPFRYLRQGRVYVAEVPDVRRGESVRRREYFWLCEQCVPRYTMARHPSRGAVCIERLKSGATCPDADSREIVLAISEQLPIDFW